MKIIKPLIITTLINLSLSSLFSQESLQLNYQGIIRDKIIEGSFRLNINILSETESITLWKNSLLIATDDKGWFGFEIKDFERFFDEHHVNSSTLTIQLALSPTEDTRWNDANNSFEISYTIKRFVRSDSLLFQITRMDDAELLFHQFEDVLFFSDPYPFSYLQGGFMLSLDTTHEKLVNLRANIKRDPDSSGEETKSRGIKGGFAVGGYSRDQ